MTVTWLTTAERLLQQRDRFTQEAIKREFEAAVAVEPLRLPCIRFDEVQQGYLTSVADGRYSVVWYRHGDEAIVQAVVPTTRFSADAADLKDRVRSVVQRESHGTVDVK